MSTRRTIYPWVEQHSRGLRPSSGMAEDHVEQPSPGAATQHGGGQSPQDGASRHEAKPHDGALRHAHSTFPPREPLRTPQGPKGRLTVRLDPDVLAWFKAQGKGYHTLINQVLRAYMEAMEGRSPEDRS